MISKLNPMIRSGKNNLRIFLIAVILIGGSENLIFSQGTDFARKKQQALFVGLSLEPSQSQIINVGILSVSKLISSKKSSVAGSLEIGYFFSDKIGVSAGAGFMSYNTQLELAGYENMLITKDSENESYERRINGSGISEVQEIRYISIPICLNLRLPFNEKTAFFLQPGIILAVPLNKKYTSSGTFTYKGYYPSYNVLLENLPIYDFPSNIKNETDDNLEIKSFGLNAAVSAGIDFFIQKKIQVATGVFYIKSLSNISGYSSPETFQLSILPDHINSIMGGSTKVTTQSLGLKISLRYYLQ